MVALLYMAWPDLLKRLILSHAIGCAFHISRHLSCAVIPYQRKRRKSLREKKRRGEERRGEERRGEERRGEERENVRRIIDG